MNDEFFPLIVSLFVFIYIYILCIYHYYIFSSKDWSFFFFFEKRKCVISIYNLYKSIYKN